MPEGFYVSNESINYLMKKVGQDITCKSVIKQTKPFSTRISIANVVRILDVSRVNHDEPVLMSVEPEEP